MEENNHHHHHHRHDEIHDYRKHRINSIHKRKVFAKFAYWLLFAIAILSMIMVVIAYKFL